MHRHLLVFCLAVGGFAIAVTFIANSPVFANTVRLDVLEVTATPDTGEPDGFFSRIRSFLGVRQPTAEHPTIEPGTKFTVLASAYAPSPRQTDSTPCITASGTRVRRGTVASNFLPLGTLLEIDGQLYIVEDRMNPRFKKSIDIFFLSTSQAVEFGRQEVEIEVVGFGEPGQRLKGLLVDEKGAITAADGSGDIQEQSISFLDKVRGRYHSFIWVTSQFLGVRTATELDRYDVDCLAESEAAP